MHGCSRTSCMVGKCSLFRLTRRSQLTQEGRINRTCKVTAAPYVRSEGEVLPGVHEGRLLCSARGGSYPAYTNKVAYHVWSGGGIIPGLHEVRVGGPAKNLPGCPETCQASRRGSRQAALGPANPPRSLFGRCGSYPAVFEASQAVLGLARPSCKPARPSWKRPGACQPILEACQAVLEAS